jgi:AbrB family looped-hinge helix DNA binding protein
MKRAPARVINDGRVTIPADVRRDLGLEKGDYVLIDVTPLGEDGRHG